MPASVGALPCDLILFAAGTIANRNDWFLTTSSATSTSPQTTTMMAMDESTSGSITTIANKLGQPVWQFRFIVFLEMIIIISFATIDEKELFLFWVFVAGIFCIDMSIAVLEFFQTNVNFHNQYTKFLSDAAYTVYLIHPLLVTINTAIFISIYNNMYDDTIQFNPDDDEDGYWKPSATQLNGPDDGGVHLFVGFWIVNLITQIIVWPLSWYIAKLPILREYL